MLALPLPELFRVDMIIITVPDEFKGDDPDHCLPPSRGLLTPFPSGWLAAGPPNSSFSTNSSTPSERVPRIYNTNNGGTTRMVQEPVEHALLRNGTVLMMGACG